MHLKVYRTQSVYNTDKVPIGVYITSLSNYTLGIKKCRDAVSITGSKNRRRLKFYYHRR